MIYIMTVTFETRSEVRVDDPFAVGAKVMQVFGLTDLTMHSAVVEKHQPLPGYDDTCRAMEGERLCVLKQGHEGEHFLRGTG